MSIFGFIGKVGGVIGKVAGIVATVAKIAAPIINALRPAVDEVDTALSWLEDNIDKAGTEADDFLDRNLPVVNAVEAVAGRGVVVFAGLQEVAVLCRKYSQEQTPDKITEDEAAELLAKLRDVRDQLRAWKPALETASKLLAEAE